MSGIHFVIDGRGDKTAVQIDLKKHRALWEDFYDNLLVENRKKEPREKWAAVKARLARAGKLHA